MRGLRLALLGALAAAPAAAQTRELVIERFASTIRVGRDASLDITEQIDPRFTGAWNGIWRAIPVEYRTAQGFNWSIRLQLLSATDENGHPLKVETSRERHYVKYKIWVPNARDATRHVVLHYRVQSGLRFFEDHDELYWNVTGDEWEVPIEQATARIELPAAAANIRAIAFNGAYGSTAQDPVISTEGTIVGLTMPHALNFHEGMTAVVGWNKGAVAEPSAGAKAWGFLATNWPLLLPIPVFLLMFTLWWRRGRDPRRLPVTVQYEPPDGLSPGEAGTLIDNSADIRDITATIVDLAVRGHLKIQEQEDEKLFGLLKGREFLFVRQRPAAGGDLKPHETKVLDGIFYNGAQVMALSDLENKFYRTIPGVKRAIFDRLVGKGYYQRRPDSVRGAWTVIAIVVGILIGFVGNILGQRWGMAPEAFVGGGVLSGLIILIFGFVMPARTVAGARALEKVLGFEEFLGRVDADRLERVVKTPELFEKGLPFAMAFGVAKQWSRAFKDIYVTPPSWYTGGNISHFNATTFSDRLSTMTSKAGSTLSSSPRSSSGSGFSGGSSGGGGGGGGGGGF
jgi:hypothetical protein